VPEKILERIVDKLKIYPYLCHNMIRTIIIDDEANIRSLVKGLLRHCIPGAVVTGEASTIADGLNLIHREQPDIVLLDVQLGAESGFDLLDKAGRIGFRVVFMTANDENTLQALRLSALDYIIKPLAPSELKNAVEKVTQVQLTDQSLKLKVLAFNLREPSETGKKIVIPSPDRFYFINVRDIVRCESESCCTHFYLSGGTEILVNRTLKEYQSILAELGFYRINNSCLINMEHIRTFDPKDRPRIVMDDSSTVQISEQKKEEFQHYLSAH
jgi:two-component system, LytTR family, response regulator